MRIGHASISENKNNGRDGKAKAGDQTGKEVCIRNFYVKPWKYLLRCKDPAKAEIMAKACEWICNSGLAGYDQSQRMTLLTELKKLNYDYTKLVNKCECDCSSFMTACAECAGIFPKYSGNAPVTANMVKLFQDTGMFDVITTGINTESNLKRGDILVGPPNTHTVMVLDTGHIAKRRVLKRGMQGSDVIILQKKLRELDLYTDSIDGYFGLNTETAVYAFQAKVFPDDPKEWDGICGPKTWNKLD